MDWDGFVATGFGSWEGFWLALIALLIPLLGIGFVAVWVLCRRKKRTGVADGTISPSTLSHMGTLAPLADERGLKTLGENGHVFVSIGRCKVQVDLLVEYLCTAEGQAQRLEVVWEDDFEAHVARIHESAPSYQHEVERMLDEIATCEN